MRLKPLQRSRVSLSVDVAEHTGTASSPDTAVCHIDEHIRFDTAALETYCFASWEPVIYDLMLVAAAVEFADRKKNRSNEHWSRELKLRIPVHEPDKWAEDAVSSALHAALRLLTGDAWDLEFVGRQSDYHGPTQSHLELKPEGSCIMSYSDGLDSRSVEAIVRKQDGPNALVRVRIGDKGGEDPLLNSHALEIAGALGIDQAEARRNLDDLIARHAAQWNAYLGALGDDSFVKQWIRGA